MSQPGWRSIVAFVAAAWFLIAALNLGALADPVALALIDLGRPLLVGLAILSLSWVDLRWTMEQGRRVGRLLNQPTT